MDQPAATAPSLFGLLAREWQRPVAVVAAVFNTDQSAVAFACADGTLALAGMADAEPPAKRVHISTETGRASIRARQRAYRPVAVVDAVDDRAPPMARHRRSCFVVGAADGRVLSITPRGQVIPFDARLGQRIVAIDHHAATERTACAAGGEVAIFAGDDTATPMRLEHDLPLAALAFSPDGRELAAAHADGLCIWRLDGPAPQRRELPFPGGPTAVSWSPGGDWIACPLADTGFRLLRLADERSDTVGGYPTPVRSLAWSRAADALVTAGAFRAVAWSMTTPPLGGATGGALETGRPGLVVVESVAAHPERDLIAVGYASGLLNVLQVGRRDELMLRPDGTGAVGALAWSPDGAHLAVGTADGVAAIVSFPPHMFK